MTAAIALTLLAVAITCAALILRLIVAQARLEQRWAEQDRQRFSTLHPNIRSPR
jgi:uncharacterized MAPEG superfamily protein